MRSPAFLIGLAIVALGTAPLPAQPPKPIPPEQFDKLYKMIKPQSNESLFMQVPWVLSLWEGREKAAAEGKPLLVWAGGWGVPIGSC
jgi:hypothetical protein